MVSFSSKEVCAVAATDVENDFLASSVIGNVEGLLYIRIVFLLSGLYFDHPVIELRFCIGMFFDELFNDPRIHNVRY